MTDDQVDAIWKTLRFDQGEIFRSPDAASLKLRGMLVRACLAAHPDHSGDGGDAVRDELMRVLTEYEGAIQEDDEEVIALAREALLDVLTPIRMRIESDAVPVPQDGDERARFEEWFKSRNRPRPSEHINSLVADTSSPASVPESAWLVEWPANENLPARWWHPTVGWCVDANVALRFSRKQDADDYIATRQMGNHGVATEHVWGSATHPAPIASAEEAAPVARITSADEYGPILVWSTHWVDLIGRNLFAHPAAAQPSRAEVLEEAAQWQWRWIGDADDAWRNSTRAECERIAGFAPEKQRWEVRTLYIHPAAARSEGQP